jgi:hypothetical protein
MKKWFIGAWAAGGAMVLVFAGTHQLPDPAAVECLHSAGQQLAQPDSAKLLQNLGKRGNPDESGFWIRYASRNQMGVYVVSNMACVRSFESGDWVRASVTEDTEIMREYVRRLKKANDAGDISSSMAEIALDAQHAVMDSSAPLPSFSKTTHH